MSIIPFIPRPDPATGTPPPRLTAPIQLIMQAIEAANLFISENITYLKSDGDNLDPSELAAIEGRIEQVEAGRYSLIDRLPAALHAAHPEDFKELISGSGEAD